MMLLLAACQEDKEELTISAASSLSEALNEVVSLFEADHPNIEIAVNYGGSGALSQQIIHGASIDMLLSASSGHFERVSSEGLIDGEYSTSLLTNELVWITAENTPQLHNINTASSIAIGTPETVPAGKYAKQSLENLGLYTEIKDKLIFAKDVRQVVQYVESGNVDMGLVYQTDAYLSKDLKINYSLPIGPHDTIEYPIGIVKGSRDKPGVQAFFHFLKTEEAQNVFEKYGFSKVVEDEYGSIFSANQDFIDRFYPRADHCFYQWYDCSMASRK